MTVSCDKLNTRRKNRPLRALVWALSVCTAIAALIAFTGTPSLGAFLLLEAFFVFLIGFVFVVMYGFVRFFELLGSFFPG